MPGEFHNIELKTEYDSSTPGGKIELVKDIIAIANTGGGQIKIGFNEFGFIGIHRSILKELDGARIGQLASEYVRPNVVSISHEVFENDLADMVGIILHIEKAGKYPFVFSRDGDYSANGRSRNVFRRGDIYVRHGAISERLSFADVMNFIDVAIQAERSNFLNLIQQIVQLPPG